MGPTVQSALREALHQILQERVEPEAASRTDSGVHAKAQSVVFATEQNPDLEKLRAGLHALLRPKIAVVAARSVPESFHPSLDALGKEYLYRITTGSTQLPFEAELAWHLPYSLSIPLMEEAAGYFLGTHDFSALCNQKPQPSSDPICQLTAIEIAKQGAATLEIVVRGNRFLYKMVRNLVGTLAYVGCGKLSLADAKLLLSGKDRRQAGITAPAHGLYLNEVIYSE